MADIGHGSLSILICSIKCTKISRACPDINGKLRNVDITSHSRTQICRETKEHAITSMSCSLKAKIFLIKHFWPNSIYLKKVWLQWKCNLFFSIKFKGFFRICNFFQIWQHRLAITKVTQYLHTGQRVTMVNGAPNTSPQAGCRMEMLIECIILHSKSIISPCSASLQQSTLTGTSNNMAILVLFRISSTICDGWVQLVGLEVD